MPWLCCVLPSFSLCADVVTDHSPPAAGAGATLRAGALPDRSEYPKHPVFVHLEWLWGMRANTLRIICEEPRQMPTEACHVVICYPDPRIMYGRPRRLTHGTCSHHNQEGRGCCAVECDIISRAQECRARGGHAPYHARHACGSAVGRRHGPVLLFILPLFICNCGLCRGRGRPRSGTSDAGRGRGRGRAEDGPGSDPESSSPPVPAAVAASAPSTVPHVTPEEVALTKLAELRCVGPAPLS